MTRTDITPIYQDSLFLTLVTGFAKMDVKKAPEI